MHWINLWPYVLLEEEWDPMVIESSPLEMVAWAIYEWPMTYIIEN
jgi:hypothetical protein